MYEVSLATSTWGQWVNSSPPGQNGCNLADNISKYIFITEKFYISIQISKFIPKGPIDNNRALI